MIKIDELNSKIDGLEKILNTKNDILQQTKDERDQINIQNQKREIQVDSAKIDLMTQAEQNSGVFSDRLISPGHLSYMCILTTAKVTSETPLKP